MSEFHIYPFEFVGHVRNVHQLTTKDLMKKVKGNVGNLAFQYPAELLFDGILKSYKRSEVISEDSILIITAANWIEKGKKSISKDLIDLATKYSKVVIYGLGAQGLVGQIPADFASELDENIVENLTKLSGIALKVGVRDQFTSDVLFELGINNTVVLGCSSIFINPSQDLAKVVIEKCNISLNKEENSLRLTMNEFTHNSKSRYLTKRDLNRAISFLKSHKCQYLLQGRHSIGYYSGEDIRLDNIFTDFLNEQNQSFLKGILDNYSVVFYDIPNWISYYSTRDLVIGTRIHGTILSIQALTPTVLITHDSRTEGLAKVLKLPFITAEDFAENDYSCRDFLEICMNGLSFFDKNRKELASLWKDFFISQNIPSSGFLNRIAG